MHQGNANLASELQLTPLLTRALRSHLQSGEVTATSCFVISQPTWTGSCTCEELITQLGAIPLIIAAMQAHPIHPGVQQYACLALGNLENLGEEALIELIVQSGAIPLVTAAMKSNPKSCNMYSSSCGGIPQEDHRVRIQVHLDHSEQGDVPV
jgi:hypothetical protein